MITIKEHINNLVEANAKHIAKLKSEEEVKPWLNSLLWAVVGFEQSISEEELHKLATEYDDAVSYVTYNAKNNGQETELEMIPWGIVEAFKAGYRKAKKE